MNRLASKIDRQIVKYQKKIVYIEITKPVLLMVSSDFYI